MTSRAEIADVLRDSLAGRLRSRAELLETARAVGARDAVIVVLERLPDRRFADLRELWPCLPGVPIEP
jgi:transposase